MTTAGTTRSVPETGSPPTDGTAFLNAVAERIPDLRVLTDTVDRESYRHDETAYQKAGLPLAVALPTETAQVAELMRLASEHRIPVVPRGAGTGLSGGAAGIEGALTIAFTKMDRILVLVQMDPADCRALRIGHRHRPVVERDVGAGIGDRLAKVTNGASVADIGQVRTQ